MQEVWCIELSDYPGPLSREEPYIRTRTQTSDIQTPPLTYTEILKSAATNTVEIFTPIRLHATNERREAQPGFA